MSKVGTSHHGNETETQTNYLEYIHGRIKWRQPCQSCDTLRPRDQHKR